MFTGHNILTDQILLSLMVASGGIMMDAKGRVVLNSPENLRALKFMVDLVKVHKVVPPSANDWKYGDDVNVLGAGKIAMDFMWAGYGTLLESMFPKVYKNIGFATIPVGPSGHSGSWSGAGGFFLFKDAKHAKEARAFIKFMSRPEISKEWCIISGNVSPFLKIAKDPELTKYDWYKSTAEQSPTTVNYGWNYGIVKGMDILRTSYFPAKGVVEVLGGKKTPEQALADMEKRVQEVLDKAKTQGAK
jgi:multiple sugar transport system substrate-binding protein